MPAESTEQAEPSSATTEQATPVLLDDPADENAPAARPAPAMPSTPAFEPGPAPADKPIVPAAAPQATPDEFSPLPDDPADVPEAMIVAGLAS